MKTEEAAIPVFPHSPGKQPKEQKNKQKSEPALHFAEHQETDSQPMAQGFIPPRVLTGG